MICISRNRTGLPPLQRSEARDGFLNGVWLVVPTHRLIPHSLAAVRLEHRKLSPCFCSQLPWNPHAIHLSFRVSLCDCHAMRHRWRDIRRVTRLKHASVREALPPLQLHCSIPVAIHELMQPALDFRSTNAGWEHADVERLQIWLVHGTSERVHDIPTFKNATPRAPGAISSQPNKVMHQRMQQHVKDVCRTLGSQHHCRPELHRLETSEGLGLSPTAPQASQPGQPLRYWQCFAVSQPPPRLHIMSCSWIRSACFEAHMYAEQKTPAHKAMQVKALTVLHC